MNSTVRTATDSWSPKEQALLHTLRLLDGADDTQLDPATIEGAHLVLEAQKLAFADREAYYGDPDFVQALQR